MRVHFSRRHAMEFSRAESECRTESKEPTMKRGYFTTTLLKQMMATTMLMAVFLVTACGGDPSGGGGGDADPLTSPGEWISKYSGSGIVAPMFGGNNYLIYADDGMFELSCNHFFISFWQSGGHGCKAVSVNWQFEFGVGVTWAISSPDGIVNINAAENQASDRLTIGGTNYWCMLWTGNLIDQDGEEEYWGSHLLLTKNFASRPSEIQEDDVVYVGFRNPEGCAAVR